MIGLIIVAIIELLIIAFLVFDLVRKNVAIDKIVKNATKIATKDIEVEDVVVNAPDNIKLLAEHINTIKLNMLAFVEATKGNVITLSDSIQILSEASKATESGAVQTSESIATVAMKATEQLELVKGNLDVIEANNTELEKIDSSVKDIKKTLNSSVQTCNSGIKNLERYEGDIKIIADNLESCVQILQQFNDQINQVNMIGDIVVDVSEELQLLALNASIEAARAGDAGKGFAVVSSEMGVMSEKTKNNMAEITEILAMVTESSHRVNDSINECNDTFVRSAAVFKELSDSLRNVSEQSSEINDTMSEIAGQFAHIADNSDVSKDKAENVFSASEIITDSTKNIVEISQETTTESAHISENVDSLEGMLEGIRKLIKQFKTGVMPSTHNRPEKVKIVFFSKLDNYFWYAIRRGVLYAEKELSENNVEIIYVPYHDDIEEKSFPADVKKYTDMKVDAIIFPGFLGIANKELADAASRGIKVFTYNCDCDKSIKRVSCYEPDQEEAGIMAAEAIAKTINKSGNVAIILGDKTANVNKLRYDSFVKHIKDNYKGINIVNTTEVTYNAEKTYNQEVELLKKHPEINAIFSTTGMQIQLAEAICDTGNKGKVKAVVFDHNADIFDYIKKGVIAAAIDHDPFSQGHDPIIYVYNSIVEGTVLPNERIKCKASIVDSNNINERISVG